MFALKLKQSKHVKDVDWALIENVATTSYDASNYLQSDFLQLLAKTKEIYKEKKKKKKGKDEE